MAAKSLFHGCGTILFLNSCLFTLKEPSVVTSPATTIYIYWRRDPARWRDNSVCCEGRKWWPPILFVMNECSPCDPHSIQFSNCSSFHSHNGRDNSVCYPSPFAWLERWGMSALLTAPWGYHHYRWPLRQLLRGLASYNGLNSYNIILLRSKIKIESAWGTIQYSYFQNSATKEAIQPEPIRRGYHYTAIAVWW